jgi:hypothetical protein
VVEKRGASSPYTFFLLLFPAVVLNLIVVIYPLIIEGIIIRDVPPVVTSPDWWFAKSLFGNFSAFPHDSFIPFLLGVYLISFLIGLCVAALLLRPIFSELLEKREVIFSEWRLLVRVVDVVVVSFLIWFAFDRVVAYLIQYPFPLGIMSGLFMFAYVVTGFITGDCVGKAVFPLRLYLLCRRDKLRLQVFKILTLGANENLMDPGLTKWVLTPVSGTQ